MENKNIAELLKDCPKSTKLYSPLCGECEFDSIDNGIIICKVRNNRENRVLTFTSEGYYLIPVINVRKCLLFPSKENKDWSQFQRPFKDGDVAISDKGGIHLLRTKDSSYCAYRESLRGLPKFDKSITTGVKVIRHATEEEKQTLFQAIKDNGYKWNAETKTLEKLVQPKFKVGDRIIKWDSIVNSWIVSSVIRFINKRIQNKSNTN